MLETIAIPKKIQKGKRLEDFYFDEKGLAPSNIKDGRELIKLYNAYQKECFLKGCPVKELLYGASCDLDRFLTKLWSFFGLEKFDFLAIVAVGGYGRREQFIASDVDLLIVSALDPIPKEAEEYISKFISHLWDLKLDLGYSVRSIRETVLASRSDITIITNLLETHFITGSKGVYVKLRTAVDNDDFWDKEKFLNAKEQEQEQRYHKYRDTVYAMEPDIKNNPGGLRDLHVMIWLAIKIYGIASGAQLGDVGLFTRSEYNEFISCRTFLWNVRYALHCHTNNNTLTMDVQKGVAESLGYGSEGNTPVENMMRDIFRTFQRIKELNNIVLQQCHLSITGYVGDTYEDPVFLDTSFVQRGIYIDVIDHELFKNDPQKIMDLFAVLSEHPTLKHIHVNCLRALRTARRRLNQYLITFPSCRKTFKKLLSNVDSTSKVFRLMHETRTLSIYMPQWEKIEGLAQFDMFHLFSVDEHIIRTLENICSLGLSKDPIYQLYKTVFRKISEPELLLTAALLHDIAKGRGGSHARKGAEEALSFCRLHDYNEYQANLVSWLVGSHLQFSATATRRDITDPEVISKFSSFVEDEEHLNLLYCLTVADISATNDTVMNSWKDNIFRQLYSSTILALREGTDLLQQMQLQTQEKQQHIAEITSGCKKSDLLRYFRQFPMEYFIHYRPEEISWHIRNILRYDKQDQPLILFSQTHSFGTQLLIYYRSNNPKLFGKVTSIMTAKHLNVFSAQLFLTHDFHALCTIMFHNQKNSPLDNDRLNSLRKAILDGLADDAKIPSPPDVESTLFYVPTRISFLEKDSSKHTQLEISTLDRQGLLAKIGITLGNLDCLISAARITTTGERADDFFAITDTFGMPLDDDKKTQLAAALQIALDGGGSTLE